MKIDVIKIKLNNSLKKLRKKDEFLLEIDTNERSITHKLACYLQQEFLDKDVDVEYNRYQNLVKKIPLPKNSVNQQDTEAKTVFPDIIIHKRGSKEDNLLVIEVKKSTNDNNNFDKVKIKAFIDDKDYKYEYGLFLCIDMKGNNDKYKWCYRNNDKCEWFDCER